MSLSEDGSGSVVAHANLAFDTRCVLRGSWPLTWWLKRMPTETPRVSNAR
jgi:hypothetical protein